jgi:hypothetical protein
MTSNAGRGGRRYLPCAFTEHGALMAANILNSPRAVAMSVYVIRAFVKMREVFRAASPFRILHSAFCISLRRLPRQRRPDPIPGPTKACPLLNQTHAAGSETSGLTHLPFRLSAFPFQRPGPQHKPGFAR